MSSRIERVRRRSIYDETEDLYCENENLCLGGGRQFYDSQPNATSETLDLDIDVRILEQTLLRTLPGSNR